MSNTLFIIFNALVVLTVIDFIVIFIMRGRAKTLRSGQEKWRNIAIQKGAETAAHAVAIAGLRSQIKSLNELNEVSREAFRMISEAIWGLPILASRNIGDVIGFITECRAAANHWQNTAAGLAQVAMRQNDVMNTLQNDEKSLLILSDNYALAAKEANELREMLDFLIEKSLVVGKVGKVKTEVGEQFAVKIAFGPMAGDNLSMESNAREAIKQAMAYSKASE